MPPRYRAGGERLKTLERAGEGPGDSTREVVNWCHGHPHTQGRPKGSMREMGSAGGSLAWQ